MIYILYHQNDNDTNTIMAMVHGKDRAGLSNTSVLETVLWKQRNSVLKTTPFLLLLRGLIVT